MNDLFASIPPHTHDSFAKVTRCSWSVFGGPEQALLTLPDEGDGLEAYQHLLGQPVEIFTGSGNMIWWGYISAVRTSQTQFPQLLDLETIVNRVCAIFDETQPGSEMGQHKQTVWYENRQSQAVFGIKEKALQLGMVSQAQADQTAADFLNDHCWSKISSDGHSVQIQQENKPSPNEMQAKTIEVTCHGWMQSLNWRTWQTKSGLLGHAPVQVGAQKIGEVSANQRLAESFKVEMTQDVSFVKLKLRKEGSPTDTLSISIQSDSAGIPSGTTLASATLSSNAVSAEGYAWCEVSFPVLPRLTAGVTYWLVIKRSGLLNPSAYYLAGVDESAGYTNGTLRLYNSSNGQWTSRIPVADLLFKFGLIISSDELFRQVYEVVGQELSGLQIDASAVWTLVPYLRNPMDGLSAFKMLLELGGNSLVPLLAEVSPTKLLRVYSQPNADSPAYLIDQTGNLCDRFGNRVGLESQPTGQWVVIQESKPVIIKRTIWEVNKARLTLNY